MKWPSAASTGDLVFARGDLPGERWFVLYSHGQPQLAYDSYAEAEGHARLYAERAGARAWYIDGRRLRLIAGRTGSERPSGDRGGRDRKPQGRASSHHRD